MERVTLLRSVAAVAVVLVSIAFSRVNCQDCQTSLTRPDGSVVCYYSIGTYVTWDTARRTCQSRGSTWHLATVTSLEENNKLTTIMDTNGVSTSWIGASEEVSTWKWLDGTEVRYQGCYKDNATVRDMDSVTLGNASSSDRCIELCKVSSYAYAGLEAGNECWCGNDFGRYGQSADATCNVACVGVQSGQTCGGESALDVYSVSGEYNNWIPGRPLNSAGNMNCAFMDSAFYQWGISQCGASYSGAFCDIGVMDEQACRDRATSFPASGRCIDVINGVAMTYFQAHAQCRLRGGELAQLKTDADNLAAKQFILFLQGAAQSGGTAVSGGFWMGLVRTRWSWESGDDFLYTNWLAGGPSAPVDATQQQCAAIAYSSSSSSSSGYWSNVACNSVKFFICQSVTASTRTTTPMQPTRSTSRRQSTTTTTTLSNSGANSGSTSTTTNNNNNNNNNNASDAAATTAAGDGDARGVEKSGSTLSAGALAGIICGSVGFVLLLILIVAIVCCCRKCKRSNSSPKTTESTSTHDVEKTQIHEDNSKLQQTTNVTNPDGNYYFGITIEDLKEPVTSDPTYEWIDNPKQPDVIPDTNNTSTPSSPPADVYANNCEIMIMPKETPKPKKLKKNSTSTENVYADCSPNTTL